MGIVRGQDPAAGRTRGVPPVTQPPLPPVGDPHAGGGDGDTSEGPLDAIFAGPRQIDPFPTPGTGVGPEG